MCCYWSAACASDCGAENGTARWCRVAMHRRSLRMETNAMTKHQDQPPACPRCESDHVVPIAYGFPGREMFEEAERGDIELGGCCVTGDDPNWICRECGHRWWASG